MDEEPTEAKRLPTCSYCGHPDADACVRMIASTSGSGRSVYGHASCAKDRGIVPLYLLTGAPKTTGHTS